MLSNGERQVASEISGIRRDHVARYAWAARLLPAGSRVVDVACGVGYGARLLAEAGHTVLAIDRSEEAIAYGREHYAHPGVTFVVDDAMLLELEDDAFDAAVCFETIEHLADPRPLLATLRRSAAALYASVPNEDKFPFRSEANGFAGWAHHHRHYTRPQFEQLLAATGWARLGWFGQEDRESDVVAEMEGRTIVAFSERGEVGRVAAAPIASTAAAPHHVAIVGLGPSAKAYFEMVKELGGRRGLADEVWAINALGDVLACDRVFHMDDVAVQEARAAARPGSNIAHMVDWLKGHPGPIYTSVVRPGYRGLVPFPLEDVLNAGGVPYFNNTVAYALAFARYIGVKKLSIYGVDFTRPNIHQGERGRACCEFWLGLCTAAGIEINLPGETTLMDAYAPEDEPWFYGYDAVDVTLHDAPGGKVRLEMSPRELPAAAEVEHRYDHSRHPNRLIDGGKA